MKSKELHTVISLSSATIYVQISRFVISNVFAVNISSIEISLTRVWPVFKLSLGCYKTRAGYTPMDTCKQWWQDSGLIAVAAKVLMKVYLIEANHTSKHYHYSNHFV